MSHIKPFLVELRTAAWLTSGARYNAARRLRRRDWFATFSIAMFSIFAVVLAVVQRVYAVPHASSLDNYLTSAAIFLGMFIAVISLVEAASNNAVKAELLHRNAEDLNTFQRKVAQTLAFVADGPIEQEVVNSFREEYERIKQQCGYNHEPLDADTFRAEQRLSPEFQTRNGEPAVGWVNAQFVRLRNFVNPFRYFIGLWLIIAVLLYLTPWHKS